MPNKPILDTNRQKKNKNHLKPISGQGSALGCTAIYTIPTGHCKEFKEFIDEIKQLGLAENAQIYWYTCFQTGRITCEWFDTSDEDWAFRWDDWMKEVQKQQTELPYTLREPASYPVHADATDVRMLMKLDKDATTDLSDIAKNLGISRQLAQFHFKKHVLGKNLIEGYEVFVMRYGETPYVMVLFVISFHNYETLVRFARSLLDKFFVLTMGKILRENAVLVETFLPTSEFRKFVDALSALAETKLVKDYKYMIQDLRMRSRQTISGEFFKDKSWVYNHKGHLGTLRQKVTSTSS